MIKTAFTRAARIGLVIVVALMMSSADVRQAYAIDEGFFSGNDILFYDPSSATCVAAEVAEVGSAGVLDIGKDFTLGQDKAKRPVELARALMKDYNLTDFQAAGVVGNFMRESGDALPPNINEGGHLGPPAFSGGYGWAQWTGGRQDTFVNFAVSKGYMESKGASATDAANYAYLNQELVHTAEKGVLGPLRSTKDVAGAASKWEELFERAGVVAGADRVNRGQRVLNALRGGGSVAGVTGQATPTSGTGTEAGSCEAVNTATQTASKTFDTVAFPLIGPKSVVNNPEIFKNNTTDRGGHPYIAFDIYANAGTKVVALASGVVTHTSQSSDLGQSVTIYNEKTGLALYYTHMSTSGHIAEGKTVSPGDFVGSLASVKQYPAINVDHLHIDASKGKYRVACSRDSCSESAKSKFVDIGADLYAAYQGIKGE